LDEGKEVGKGGGGVGSQEGESRQVQVGNTAEEAREGGVVGTGCGDGVDVHGVTRGGGGGELEVN
jgi:hypothetical protein